MKQPTLLFVATFVAASLLVVVVVVVAAAPAPPPSSAASSTQATATTATTATATTTIGASSLQLLPGTGFHRKLMMTLGDGDNSKGHRRSSTVKMAFSLPKYFFLDVFEVVETYTLVRVPTPQDKQQAQQTASDTSRAMPSPAPSSCHVKIVSVTPEHVFDLEAPSFRIPYETNKVVFEFGIQDGSEEEKNDATLQLGIVFPVHLRYDAAEKKGKTNAQKTQDEEYTLRCIFPSSKKERSVEDADAVDGRNGDERWCVRIPVGKPLAHESVVRYGTMGLMVVAAAIIYGFVAIPPSASSSAEKKKRQ